MSPTDTRPTTLLDLVKRSQAGDEQALAELLSRFTPLIRQCCKGLSYHDAQDLQQELHLRLFQLINRY